MSNNYTNLINWGKSLVAAMGGANYSFTITRPPYTSGDNSGTVVAIGVKAHVEPSGPNWAQDKIPDAEFYEVCANPSLFQNGDIFNSNSDIPIVTVFSSAEGQEFLAIKTDKTCRIEDASLEILYSNLQFDFMNSTSAGPDEFYQDQTSLNVAVRRAIMYAIPGLPEGMSLIDEETGWRWRISKIDYKMSLMVLFLDQPNRT